MFGEMRRKKQALHLETCEKILERGNSGVLALEGEEGYPYAVPLSYFYEKQKIFFHCARNGYKIEAIKRNEKASFCVIDQDQIVPEEYTTYFRSVIVFGKIRILESEEEKRRAIENLAWKYAPEEPEEKRNQAVDREFAPLCMLELSIEHISGKEAIELVRKEGRN